MSWKPWNVVGKYSETRQVASYSLSDSSAGLQALWCALSCVLAPFTHVLGMIISSEPVGLAFCSPVGRRNEVLEATLEHVFVASGNVSGSDFWQPYVICQRISKVPCCFWPQRKQLKDQNQSCFSLFLSYNGGFRIGSWWGWCWRTLEQWICFAALLSSWDSGFLHFSALAGIQSWFLHPH